MIYSNERCYLIEAPAIPEERGREGGREGGSGILEELANLSSTITLITFEK